MPGRSRLRGARSLADAVRGAAGVSRRARRLSSGTPRPRGSWRSKARDRTDRKIVLLGMVDLNLAHRQMLDQVAAHVTALDYRRAGVRRPLRCSRLLDSRGLDDCRVTAPRMSKSPESMARPIRRSGHAVVGVLGGRYRADEIVVGMPDERSHRSSNGSWTQWALLSVGRRPNAAANRAISPATSRRRLRRPRPVSRSGRARPPSRCLRLAVGYVCVKAECRCRTPHRARPFRHRSSARAARRRASLEEGRETRRSCGHSMRDTGYLLSHSPPLAALTDVGRAVS